MSTPARLVKLNCPHCQGSHGEIDNDFRGSSRLGELEVSRQRSTSAIQIETPAHQSHSTSSEITGAVVRATKKRPCCS